MSHEDIRRSLEVLDSVLAEFDDCLESWDHLADDQPPPALSRQCGEKDSPEKSVKSLSFENQTLDGSTSHDSGLSLQEQIRVTSPPPVPKRSATTKLSDRNSGLFTFPPADYQSLDSLSSDSAPNDNGQADSVNNASSPADDDEVFGRARSCAKCGCPQSDDRQQAMENNKENLDASSSPFSERRKMFEDRIGESKSNVSPLLLQRSFAGSSFKRRTDRTKEPESEPASLKLGDGDSGHQPNFVPKYSPKATKVIPPRVDGLLSLPTSFHHSPNCNCKERIRQLQAKFAETRRLLKANKIRGLDVKPPSFVPPPPSEVAAKRNAVVHSSKKLQPNRRSQSSGSLNASNLSLHSVSLTSENSSSRPSPLSDSGNSSVPARSPEQKLCDRCSTSEPLSLSETIEDIPRLLPTDALKRPHLGLSYSMEDDLSPGVKEILQTSTPADSSQLSKNTRVTSLSTFSLSDSSLGYVSSQSDLELSNSPMKVEKVPVTSIKFSTLPEGMDLHSLPSYYGQGVENGHKKSDGQPVYRDRNFNRTRDPQVRSSSVSPPPPEPEKPKKKHFRGFSRKDKKDKKKNGEFSVEMGRGANLLASNY